MTTGLLLGAGASYELGMPLVWELTAEIRRWLTVDKIRELNAGWKTQGNGYADAVIDEFSLMLERPSMHYEAILGNLEVNFRRNNRHTKGYHGFYSWLVEIVYRLLYHRQTKNNKYIDHHLPYHDGFQRLAETNSPLWVFSLNHDVMVEMIAARLAIPVHTGFSPTTVTLPRRDAAGAKIGEIRAVCLSKDDLEKRGMYFPNPGEPGICLLKIHGALDIFTFNNGYDLLKLMPNGNDPVDISNALRAANEDLIYPLAGRAEGHVRIVNEIAYADDAGEMQFLRRSLLAGAFKFDTRHPQVLPLKLLGYFRHNLNFVSRLVCIGYGFADLHINAALREWLEFSANRQLDIVNPNIADVPSFLQHLHSQVRIKNLKFTDWLDEEAGIVRSSRELLQKELTQTIRTSGHQVVQRAFNTFFEQNQRRFTEELIAKVESLPKSAGRPDFSSLGDPQTTVKQWASELELGE